jgi:hypothetical protein
MGVEDSTDTIWISIFTIVFSQIQIIEAMIWAKLEENPNADVENIVRYIVPLLWLQPIVQTTMAYISSQNIFMFYSAIFFVVIAIYQTVKAYYFDKLNVSVSERHHLIWNRYSGKSQITPLGQPQVTPLLRISTPLSPYGYKYTFFLGDFPFPQLYLLGVFVPLIFIKNKRLAINLLIYGLLSLVVSMVVYPDEFGSMWCFIANGYTLTTIITLLVQKLL